MLVNIAHVPPSTNHVSQAFDPPQEHVVLPQGPLNVPLIIRNGIFALYQTRHRTRLRSFQETKPTVGANTTLSVHVTAEDHISVTTPSADSSVRTSTRYHTQHALGENVL